MRRSRSILVVCGGIAGLASASAGALWPGCCLDQFGASVAMDLKVGYTVTGTVLSASASGFVFAGVLDVEYFSIDQDNGCGHSDVPRM